jgi:hypothetical protein
VLPGEEDVARVVLEAALGVLSAQQAPGAGGKKMAVPSLGNAGDIASTFKETLFLGEEAPFSEARVLAARARAMDDTPSVHRVALPRRVPLGPRWVMCSRAGWEWAGLHTRAQSQVVLNRAAFHV